MTTDWLRWHRDYDTPDSSLARRLLVVREYLGRALTEAPAEPDGTRRLISMCAGDGRDVLPVLAGHDAGRGVRAVLAELDPELAGRARDRAAELGLTGVEVRTADAGRVETYLGATPAHIVLACGVFGNISSADMRRTVAALPALTMPGGVVIWTRGRSDGPVDASLATRAAFAEHGFAELAFTRPAGARFRVGMCRAGDGGSTLDGKPLFTFR